MRASSPDKKNGSAGCVNNQQSLFDHSVIAHVAATDLLCADLPVRSKRHAMDARQAKGLEIAANSEIVYEGNIYLVPSQSGSQKYHVDFALQTCTCLDFAENKTKCKHLHAAEFSLQRESGVLLPVLEKITKPTYKQVWPAYNLAQTNEKSRFLDLLYHLCFEIGDLPRKPGAGRARLPLRDMIFCVVFKIFSTVSGRRFISDLREAQQRDYITKTPHFNSIFNYLELAEMTDHLKQMIVTSSLPLRGVEWDFAVDSSGFSTGQFTRWLHAKHGGNPHYRDQEEWIKVHLMCGVMTNIVTSVEVTGRNAGDSPQFKPLVEQTARNFVMNEISADKAYSSEKNLQLTLVKGAQPYIAFRCNATGANRRSGEVWKRMYHLYQYNQQDYMQHYHKRSNVESTFSMIKGKFGERLRSKTDTAQVNEVLCKVLCHNICCVIQSIYELGIEADFYGGR